jgi:DNA-binding NtrC family response regulator
VAFLANEIKETSLASVGTYRMAKILIIDDNADTTELLKVLLEQRGHSTRIVETRDEAALDALTEFSPQVVMVDYLVSGMPASIFIEFIRVKQQDTQVVLMSGMVDRATALAAELGVAMLSKPFVPETVYEIIERVTGSGQHVAID